MYSLSIIYTNHLSIVSMFRKLVLLLILSCHVFIEAQNPLYPNILVSDTDGRYSIGEANTSRNIAINKNGEIYIVFYGNGQIRVAKSEDRGKSFLPSVLVSREIIGEPEIAVNERGDVFVSWFFDLTSTIYLSISRDGGTTFTDRIKVGDGTKFAHDASLYGHSGGSVHMATYENYLYIIDKTGSIVHTNKNYGEGEFSNYGIAPHVFADIRTNSKGNVFLAVDDPFINLFRRVIPGRSFRPFKFQTLPEMYYSSYALNEGPCGDFIFFGGGGDETNNEGYRIDLNTGNVFFLNLGTNDGRVTGRTMVADNRGSLIDGYNSRSSGLMFRVSYDQGDNFSDPVFLARGTSHNLEINHKFDDVVAVYSSGGKIYTSVYDDILKGIVISTKAKQPICLNTPFELIYDVRGVFNPNSNFDVILSDEEGDFNNGQYVTSVITNTSGSIIISLPENLAIGKSYRIKLVSTENCTESNWLDISVWQPETMLQETYMVCDSDFSMDLTSDPNFLTHKWVFENGTVISNTFEATISELGNYKLIFNSENGGEICQNIFNFKVERFKVGVSDIKITQFSDENSIEIIPFEEGLLEYSLDGVNYQDSNVFNYLSGGKYTVHFRDKVGCGIGQEKVFILGYSKFFTPNNDGFNDLWHINGIENYPEATVIIYDRYGKIINKLSASSLGWDGTFNGRKLPNSDYWFVANLSRSRQISGHFTLKR